VGDAFADMFGSVGWVRVNTLDPSVAARAVDVGRTEGLDAAETKLVDHYSSAWVADRLGWLRYLEGFRERYPLALLALEDYKAGKFYASALVTLALMDGWVNDLNVVDGQRRSLFSDETARPDAALPPALCRLQQVFGRRRMATRTDKITIPYRHGILHGMDLGYNNRIVAAKCWAALFAVRDWAVALTPWEPADRPAGPPDRVVSECLAAWHEGDYTRMANCVAPMMRMIPANVLDQVAGTDLRAYGAVTIEEWARNTCAGTVRAEVSVEGRVAAQTLVFSLALNGPDGDLVWEPGVGTVWGITGWHRRP